MSSAREGLRTRERRRRGIAERLELLFPGVARRLRALAVRALSPSSGLRRALVGRLVRSQYGALNRRDLEVFLARLDPGVEESVSDLLLGEPATFRGHAGASEQIERVTSIFDQWRVVPEEVIDTGDQILVIARVSGVGKRSGVEVSARTGHLITMRNGMTIRFEEFKDVEEAAKAAGLPLEDASRLAAGRV